MTRAIVATVSALAAACGAGDPTPPGIDIVPTPTERALIEKFVETIPYDRVRVIDPDVYEGAGVVRIEVVPDLVDCVECYRIERTSKGLVVRGDAPLGIQYGLAHALELAGFRFFHPWRTFVPSMPRFPPRSDDYDRTFQPDMQLRGIHLHTLHPIEGYFATWTPGDDRRAAANRIFDWIVKNRGNYVEWVALDDIQRDGATADAWRAHTKTIVDDAHARGLRVGIGVQLFGASNLQLAFDLVDAEPGTGDPRAEIRANLPIALDGIAWDHLSLSFGEFFGADPAVFVDAVNTVREELVALAPEIELTATIHVGNNDELRVTYMGEELLYYFLVDYADPAIVPWVHTVMYYDLFEDAGGAYLHDRFDEHRAYLLARLAAGERVAYYPETAYWVAFDNSVPTYLPLYVRSRWLDAHEIAAAGAPLGEHVLFSSGWEWGYWQNDWASLRLSYDTPPRWEDLFEEMWAPVDPVVGSQIVELTRAQHRALIGERLAPYLAGRDLYIDLGDEIGVVSQPDRPSFEEVAAMRESDRWDYEFFVVNELDVLARDVEQVLRVVELRAGDPFHGDPFIAETIDGVKIDLARTRYILSLYLAVLHLDATFLEEAEAWLAEAREIVARRHARLHYPAPLELVGVHANATLYPFGYLEKADSLCYWEREMVQARNVLTGADDAPPACVY